MATLGAQVSVTNTATLLYQSDADGSTVLVCNRGTSPVFVGSAAVTTATGFQLDPGTSISLDLDPAESLSAIAATAGPFRVDVLRNRA